MKQFASIEKLDRSILYALELASSVSILLLALGLIASMANVLTQGQVLTDHVWMQQIWAWTQCVGIDASVAGTIIRTFQYHVEGEKVKMWLYALLSTLLLFTAAIVSNIESVQQTLNITLEKAYIHVFVPLEVLIWIRSIAIVLLIVAHAMRHVQMRKSQETIAPAQPEQPTPFTLTPEMLDQLRTLLTQTIVLEDETQKALPAPTQDTLQESKAEGGSNLEVNNYERVKMYLAERCHIDCCVTIQRRKEGNSLSVFSFLLVTLGN